MYQKLYEKKCRVCLCEDVNEFVSIFSNNENVNSSITNAELIMACSSVKIIEDDGLPKNICRICYDKLSRFYEFKLLCENSDKFLHINAIKQEEKDTNIIYLEENYNINEDNSTKATVYTCNYCSEVYKSELCYTQHSSLCMKRKRIVNKTKCNKKISLKSKESHSQKIDLKKTIRLTCPNCRRDFNTKDDLRIHFEDCIKKSKSFGKSTTTTTSNNCKVKILPKKIQEYINPSKLKCLICNEDFQNVTAHYKQTHKTSNCPSCGKLFTRFHYFLSHLKQGCHGPKKYLCPYCGRCFKEKGNLTKHLKIHTGEKPYVCDICNKAFAHGPTLRRHKIVHTTEKNYACEICGRAFATLTYLNKHSLSHSDERKYSCGVCGRKFKHPESVRSHMVIHTGAKNYKCEVCGKVFGFKKNLVVHRRTHTGDKPFTCEICLQRFTQRHCLRSHMESQHKNL